MQLQVTERKFCDFVLYAEQGPVSIERIYPDLNVIGEISSNLTTFWKRVIAPEFFEMRVPRRLNPFILSDDSQSYVDPVEEIAGIDNDSLDELTVTENYTYNELCIADLLSNSMQSLQSDIPNLVAVPWGGMLSNGVQLLNTCPIDNKLADDFPSFGQI